MSKINLETSLTSSFLVFYPWRWRKIFKTKGWALSWKAHKEFFPKFQFSGAWHRPISLKIIHRNFMCTWSVTQKHIGAWWRPISWQLIHIWMSLPVIRSLSRSEIREILFFAKMLCFGWIVLESAYCYAPKF